MKKLSAVVIAVAVLLVSGGTGFAMANYLEELKETKKAEINQKHSMTFERTTSYVETELEAYKKQRQEQLDKTINSYLQTKLDHVSEANMKQANKYIQQQKELIDRDFKQLEQELKTYIDNLE
jgi:dihydroxyacetone kinase